MNSKVKGFSIFELMIVIAILGIIGSILFCALGASGVIPNISSSYQVQEYQPPAGPDFQCLEGYKFVVYPDGKVQQILNTEGAGVPCNGS